MVAGNVARLAPIPGRSGRGPSSGARAGSCGPLVCKVLNKRKRRLSDIPVRVT